MTDQVVDADLAARLEDVTQSMQSGIDVMAIRAMLEEMLATMGGHFGTDPGVIKELEELSAFIDETKTEISAIRPEEIADEHIPTATDELDAIVTATENATNSIMEATETIENVAEAIGGEHAEQLSDAVTNIFEACSFQDITGQRISKVVEALREIDQKVETVIERFGPDEETREELKRKRMEEKEQADGVDAAVDEESDLLNGPQLPQNANSQDEIDALLAELG